MKHIDSCPACGADARRSEVVHVRSRDSVMRCPHCHDLFSNPRYTSAEAEALYKEYYDAEFSEAQLHWDFQENAKVLHQTALATLRRRYPQLVKPGKRILDYGCGLGFFLAEAQSLGLECRGIELSEVAARYAREKHGLHVHSGGEQALADEAGSTYDLVTSFAVLEHVLEPRRTLRILIDKLKPGGVLALTLPNLGCWRYRIEGGRWFNVNEPTHFTFYSIAGIRSVLEGMGMKDVRRVVYWGGRPGFGPQRNAVQYMARLLNLGSEFRIVAQKQHSVQLAAA